MIEALWSVEFGSSLGAHGHGIAVFETGRVFGGDSSMMYTGGYKVENGQIHAEINVEKYANFPGMHSIVGMDKFTLVAQGKADPHQMHFRGHVKGNTQMQIAITAKRRAELPNPG